MASARGAARLTGLGRAMVRQGLLSDEEADRFLAGAVEDDESFVAQLLRRKRFTADEIARFAAQAFGLPWLDLDAIDEAGLPLTAVDASLLDRHGCLPLLQRGNRLFLAVADPGDLQALEDVKFQTGLVVEPVVVAENKLLRLRDRLKSRRTGDGGRSMDGEELGLAAADAGATATPAETVSVEIDDAPVVRYLQRMMLDAIDKGASDIHFEPYEKHYRIRYRLDGILYEVARPPLAIKDRIASRIKVISKMDISEKRVPQDGGMKLILSAKRSVDFRVSSLPTLYGEKIVMRILDPSTALNMPIDRLGYEPEQLRHLLAAIARPYGMILVTGPTGSGKTVSLYACLKLLNRPGANISTVEDPVEIQLPGVNQVNVNEKAGLGFAAALRAFLRQDPDIVMLGEIRDTETADIAIKAAQTGHLVLSTLHTNDAPSTLVRLVSMGIPTYSVAAQVILITAQRLARRLCNQCKRPVGIAAEALRDAGFAAADLGGDWQAMGAAAEGCPACNHTGYKGRVGIYQVMPVTEAMRELIQRNASAMEIAAQARREGVDDLRQAGLKKVRAGITSLEEVLAVTND